MAGRFKELLKKYGKVAVGVHLSVSAATVSGIYVSIKNNVDVEQLLEKIGMPTGFSNKNKDPNTDAPQISKETDLSIKQQEVKPRNRTAELVASSGGALTLAILLNKALFPVRVPITIVLTPPIARFLARRKLIKTSV